MERATEPRLCGGAALVLDAVGFAQRLVAADAVVVGEGCLDDQTLHGKIAGEILGRAGGRPVHAVVGSVGGDDPGWAGFASVRVAGTPDQLRAAGAEIAAAMACG